MAALLSKTFCSHTLVAQWVRATWFTRVIHRWMRQLSFGKQWCFEKGSHDLLVRRTWGRQSLSTPTPSIFSRWNQAATVTPALQNHNPGMFRLRAWSELHMSGRRGEEARIEVDWTTKFDVRFEWQPKIDPVLKFAYELLKSIQKWKRELFTTQVIPKIDASEWGGELCTWYKWGLLGIWNCRKR